MSKQELVCAPIKSMILTSDSGVKFEGKINTSDLIEAVVFEKEEQFQKEIKELTKQKRELQDKIDELSDKRNQFIENLGKNYDVSKYDKMVKLLNEFNTDKKKFSVKANYCRLCDNNKIYIDVIVSKGDNYTNICRKDIIPHPKELVNITKQLNNLYKQKKIVRQKLDKSEMDCKELPLLKKKVKAEFVKTMVRGDNLSTQDMLNQLREALLGAV